VPIRVRNRIQFNFQVEKIPNFDWMENMKEILIPTFWIEESLDLDQKIINTLRYGLHL
jgi:hypothetical protein